MPVLPDPDPSLSADRRLWVGLTAGLAAIVVLAITVHKLVPASSPVQEASQVKLPNNAPLLALPQRLENQQAMPELADFDAQTPAPDLSGGSGLLPAPGAPSPGRPGGPSR
jgi:hypothetical protein